MGATVTAPQQAHQQIESVMHDSLGTSCGGLSELWAVE